MKRFPVATLLLAVPVVAIHLIRGLTEALQFDRAAIFSGEIWRVFTGHLTHGNDDHLRWDLIMFIAFGALVELRSRRGFFICVLASAAAVSTGVILFEPELAFYRGLSGIDSALFCFISADLLRSGWRSKDALTITLFAVALIGFFAKCVYELSAGTALFVDHDPTSKVVPLAHLIGAIVGIGTGLARKLSSHSLNGSSRESAESVSPHPAAKACL